MITIDKEKLKQFLSNKYGLEFNKIKKNVEFIEEDERNYYLNPLDM